MQDTAQPTKEGIGSKKKSSVCTLRRTVMFLESNFFIEVVTTVITEKQVLRTYAYLFFFLLLCIVNTVINSYLL